MSDKTKTVKVSNTDDLKLALTAGYEPDQIVIDNTDAVAAARAEGVAEGKASGTPDVSAAREAGAKAERERIAKLNSLAVAGFDAELKAAIDDGTSPEAFAMTLLTAAKDRGITLDAIRKDAKSTTHVPPSADKGDQPKLDAASIFEARRKAAQ